MNEISINELKNLTKKDTPEEPSKREKEMGDLMSSIDKTIERVRNEAVEFHEKLEKEDEEEKLEKEINGEEGEETGGNDDENYSLNDDDISTNPPKEDNKKFVIKQQKELFKEDNKQMSITEGGTTSLLNINPEDLPDDEQLDESKDQINQLKTSIKAKVKPITNVIDISSFTISKKTVSVSNALTLAGAAGRVIDWVLPATARAISVKEFKAYDIEKLNPRSSARNRFNTYRDIYKLIYDHVVDANKAASLEAWVKGIKFYDIDHLYFAIFKAAFDKVNAVPYNCEQCKNVFLNDISIEEMIKYKSDEIKDNIAKLLSHDTTTENDNYEVELMQVSDSYVIGFKEPTIYDVIFENAVLDEQFTDKYKELLAILIYIDSIYVIDAETKQLIPIESKIYPNNIVKTIKTKIVKYSDILKTLTSDQFYNLNAIIESIKDRYDIIDYILPEAICPKCGTKIPEVVQSAESLLFTRHRLMGIANMSID